MESNRTDYSGRNQHRRSPQINMDKIDRLLIDVQRQLRDSLEPAKLENLNSYERKMVHSFFDNKSDYVTKTYRRNDQFVLKIFPVSNLQRQAKEKAGHVLETGETYTFPFLQGFERYIIHNYLQTFEGIETISIGEEKERRLEIRPVKFGRSLKKIIRKIKLF